MSEEETEQLQALQRATLDFTCRVLGAYAGAVGRLEAVVTRIGQGTLLPVDVPLQLEAARVRLRRELASCMEATVESGEDLAAFVNEFLE